MIEQTIANTNKLAMFFSRGKRSSKTIYFFYPKTKRIGHSVVRGEARVVVLEVVVNALPIEVAVLDRHLNR